MNKNITLGIQLAYYGMFLTGRQQSLLRQWVDEDLSLSEIAQNEGISRQGVYDALKRAKAQLEKYEETLGLIKKEAQTKKCIIALKKEVDKCKDAELKNRMLEQIDYLQGIWEETDGL